MTDLNSVKSGLEARLTELEARAARIEADLAEPLSADFAEQAIEREDDDALEGQDALLGREIVAVKAALARVEEGSYGECTRCGEDVGEKRLEAYPEAALCITCAREIERR
ncbi:MAG: TraR/DksA C4-type zinc finger protein [Sphingomonadales bacterium]|jgi:DnaK suppressor protein|nr:TraR/DksA C4-type zinc finger protein [Sphingomonadales bacterium]MBK9003188.1 TraR/DksA C4-type zinc finger protein [Sphingomonadales bacterium]MBK9268436.1 TraR/DksA C4-type zinc finger protein [Sphingomonadales bacterium]